MPEIVRSNPANSPDNKPVKTHSSFKPNYTRFDSHRFGLNTPHFAMAAVADDDISMRCVADVDTMALKAPLMVPVKRSMDYFQVPVRAILPNTAELLLTNPRTGDDIDPREVNCLLRRPNADGESYDYPLYTILQLIKQSIVNLDSSVTVDASSYAFSAWVNGVFRLYQVCRPLFLSSSLPKYLGYSLDKLITVKIDVENANGVVDQVRMTLTEFFELLFSTVSYYLNQAPHAKIIADEYRLNVSAPDSSHPYGNPGVGSANHGIVVLGGQSNVVVYNANTEYAPLSYLLDKIIESPNVYIVEAEPDATFGITAGTHIFFSDAYSALTGNDIQNLSADVVTPTRDINISKCVAYQLCSAEFYTNDRVDGVYSSKLYMDNLKMLAMLTGISVHQTNFTVNGVTVEYDPASARILNLVLLYLYNSYNVDFTSGRSSDPLLTSSSALAAFMYVRDIFDFTRSLRFEDYFVGARVSPLAVGDVSVGVDTNDNTVDIIDVTKNIQVQRFLNQVNRVGRKFRDYIKGIFGDIPLKDCHEPLFLGHVADTIGAEETDNTGAGQLTLPNSTTSKLRNNSARFGFDVHCSEPSILIGITNYDIPRAYGSVTDRDNLHVDRFDMFNPFLQFVGDQEVFSLELSPAIDDSNNPTFGYAGRYSEYKQRVDVAGGAFATRDALPGYAMVVPDTDIPKNIDSDFLRSHVTDLDEFYVSRTGLTECYRFNFIVRCDNSVSAKRPMAFNPSIL